MTDIQIVILDTIKELAIENNVNEDEIKYFQIAYSLAKKLNDLAKDNEVLGNVVLCRGCGSEDTYKCKITDVIVCNDCGYQD